MTIAVSSEMEHPYFASADNVMCCFVTCISAVQAATEHSTGTCLVVLIFSDGLTGSAGCIETVESSPSLTEPGE